MDRSRRHSVPAAIVTLVVTAVAIGVLASCSVAPSPSLVIASPSTSPTVRPTPSPVLTLRVDGLARVASSEDIVVHRTPRAQGKPLTPALETGDLVYVTRGPRLVDGVDWWEVQPDYESGSNRRRPFGWVRGADDDGHPTLTPVAPDCPTAGDTVDPSDIARIHTLQALACFGHAEITVQGDLRCDAAIGDGGAGGVWWKNSYWHCVMDEALAMYGRPIDALAVGSPQEPVRARYRATGHFDDPDARRCHMLPIGVSLDSPGEPEPEAVIWCRQDFVVTGLANVD